MKLNPNLLLDVLFPVGAIYINTTGTNPGTFLGGTWESFGNGRVLVGQDTNDTDFDTLLETGGSKTDNLSNAYAKIGRSSADYANIAYKSKSVGEGTFDRKTASVGGLSGNSNVITEGTALGGSISTLQPYIVVSMWKRTA